MTTLYDFLGALPDDDAESLRVAFRRAAKSAHPDLNPTDPAATLRFRQLVRANNILSNNEQRALYDRLLHLARVDQRTAPKRATAILPITMGVACGVIALTGILVVFVVGNDIFLPTRAQKTEIYRHEPASAGSISTDLSNTLKYSRREDLVATTKLGENPEYLVQPTAPRVAAAADGTTSAMASADVPAIRDFATNDAKHYRERGILAYRSGNLHLALFDFALAIHFDPSLSDAYIDRAIVLYRMGDQERAFADVARAKRLDHETNQENMPPTTSAP